MKFALTYIVDQADRLFAAGIFQSLDRSKGTYQPSHILIWIMSSNDGIGVILRAGRP